MSSMIAVRVSALLFVLLSGMAPALADAGKPVGDPALRLVAVPATGEAIDAPAPAARRAAPANDEIEGATDLGAAFPIGRTFTFGSAGVGTFETDGRATASVWFRFKTAKSGFYAATLAPTASGSVVPLSMDVSDGLVSTSGVTSAQSTRAKPLKISAYLSQDRIYYISANLLSSRKALRAAKIALRVTFVPNEGVLYQNPRRPTFVRDAATDGFKDFFPKPLLSAFYGDYGPKSPALEMSGSVTYETGPKDVLEVAGLPRRAIPQFGSFTISGIIRTIPAALKRQGVFRFVARATDHTLGLTVDPDVGFIMTDVGGAATSITATAGNPSLVRPGARATIEIFVKNIGSKTATGCHAMSDRAIGWRWYDMRGTRALAPADTPIAIAPGVMRRLVVTIPTAASHPEVAPLGLAADCTNTAIAAVPATVVTSTVPPPKVTIDVVDGGKRLDFFTAIQRNVDILVRNGGAKVALVRISLESPFPLHTTFAPQSCLIVAGKCVRRFSDVKPRFDVAPGKTVRLRVFVRPYSFGAVAPDYLDARLTAVAEVRVRTLFEQEIFYSTDHDFAEVSLDCPKPKADGSCPPL